MKIVITVHVDEGDWTKGLVAARLRNRKGFVGDRIPFKAMQAVSEALYIPFLDPKERPPRVTRATTRIEL